MEELLLKISENKPPFIGIIFEKPAHTHWHDGNYFEHFANDIYQVELDPAREMILYLVHGKSRMRYAINYEPVTLLKFIVRTLESKQFSFGIVYRNGSGFDIGKTESGKKMVLTVDKVTVITDPLMTMVPQIKKDPLKQVF